MMTKLLLLSTPQQEGFQCTQNLLNKIQTLF